jgi:hypothetical protein
MPRSLPFAQVVATDPPQAYAVLVGLQGRRHPDWTPPTVILHKRSEGRFLKAVHMPALGYYALVVNGRAKDVLEGVFADEAEFLPLACPDMPLWLVNNLNVVDALDEERSEIVRTRDGRIMDLVKPVFHADRIAGRACFTVPQMVTKDMYFTDPVADAIRAAGLTGLDLDRPVWTDEAP